MVEAALRHELSSHHEYEFVEGSLPHPPAPGKLCVYFTSFTRLSPRLHGMDGTSRQSQRVDK